MRVGIGITRWLCAGSLLVIGCDPVVDDGGEGGGDGKAGTGAADGADGADGGEDPVGAVAAHNEVRATAQPTPSPALPAVVWDAELAGVAQQWANGCVFEHSSNGFGENLYVGTGTPSAEAAIQSWADEIAMYDYGSNGCSGVCGHYTQIVWRDTTRIGCAFADCDAVVGVNFSGRLWVCNYDPPGNFIGQQPY